MQLRTEIEDAIKAAASKFESVDHQALNVLEAVQSNPATAEGLTILGQLTHLPPEVLAVPLSMLRGALQALGGQPQPAPAGPVVAGQA